MRRRAAVRMGIGRPARRAWTSIALASWMFVGGGGSPAFADPDQDCRQTDDVDLAINACSDLLQAATDNSQIRAYRINRATAYFNKRDFYHAVEDYTAAIAIEPSVDAYINRGLANENQIQDNPAFAESAITDLGLAVGMNPNITDANKKPFAQAYATRGATALGKGQDAEAQAAFNEADRLDHDEADRFKAQFAEAYSNRAWQRIADGQYDQGAADLKAAIDLVPVSGDQLRPSLAEAQAGSAGPYIEVGLAERDVKNENYDAALAAYNEAIRLKPDLAAAYVGRAFVYWALRDTARAQSDFAQAVKLDPSRWDAFLSKSRLEASVDAFDQAQADLDLATAAIDKMDDAKTKDYAQKQVDAQQKVLEFDKTMNGEWTSYLKEIQADNNYPNWPSAPYDLYLSQHGEMPAPSAVPSEPKSQAAHEDQDSGPDSGTVALLFSALLAALGICWGAFVLDQRRRARRAAESEAGDQGDW